MILSEKSATFRDHALNSRERERNALPHPHAHGGERELAAALRQPMRRRQNEPCARHSKRMAERDRAAVGIDVRGIVRNAKLP
jgi:hypothetical protein